jgi:TusA-related sulfurtransferase
LSHQCTDPILCLKQDIKSVAVREFASIIATDPGFAADLRIGCRGAGHKAVLVVKEYDTAFMKRSTKSGNYNFPLPNIPGAIALRSSSAIKALPATKTMIPQSSIPSGPV